MKQLPILGQDVVLVQDLRFCDLTGTLSDNKHQFGYNLTTVLTRVQAHISRLDSSITELQNLDSNIRVFLKFAVIMSALTQELAARLSNDEGGIPINRN